MGRHMGLMIKGGVIFCAIIGNIVGTRSAKEPELALSFTAAESVVLHVHCFGFELYDCVIGNPNCSVVITLYGRFRLRPTYIYKGLTKLDHVFGADKDTRNSGFGSRGNNKLDYLGESENRAIYGRDMGVF